MKWHHKVKRAATAWNGGAIDLHLYAVVSVALISGLLLWWTNVSWRENLAAYQPVFSKLRQIRADVVRGYLGAVRSLAGNRTFIWPMSMPSSSRRPARLPILPASWSMPARSVHGGVTAARPGPPLPPMAAVSPVSTN